MEDLARDVKFISSKAFPFKNFTKTTLGMAVLATSSEVEIRRATDNNSVVLVSNHKMLPAILVDDVPDDC